MEFSNIHHWTESVEAVIETPLPTVVAAAAAAAPEPAWTNTPASVNESSSSLLKPAVYFQIAFASPKSGWTDENRVVALAFLRGCLPAADKNSPRSIAKFGHGRKHAVFGLASQEHVIAATLKPLVIFGETLSFNTNVKPPPPPATKVKVTDLPIGYTEAIVRHAASKYGKVRYVSKDVLRDHDDTILCDLDACAVFFEPGSRPARSWEILGHKCPVWDNRLDRKPFSKPAAKAPAPASQPIVATSATAFATTSVSTAPNTSSSVEAIVATIATTSATTPSATSTDEYGFSDVSSLNRHQRKRPLSPSNLGTSPGRRALLPPPPATTTAMEQ
jgi:hypothetical protein